jgi:hypothetical protein
MNQGEYWWLKPPDESDKTLSMTILHTFVRGQLAVDSVFATVSNRNQISKPTTPTVIKQPDNSNFLRNKSNGSVALPLVDCPVNLRFPMFGTNRSNIRTSGSPRL